MFTKTERLISSRNLRPKKKEGFLKVISIFSFLGIMLGVAILIIVMSVMNGFRNDLTNKILGLNPHIVIQANKDQLDKKTIKYIKEISLYSTFLKSYNGEGIILSKNNAKGILVKGVDKDTFKKLFIDNILTDGNYNNFKKGSVLIGNELAFDLGLKIGDKMSLMSSSFISTPLGSVPNQDDFIVAGIFNSGFYEFDKNLIFLNLSDSLYMFNKTNIDINIELYLKKPIEAEYYKDEIQKIEPSIFIYTWGEMNKSFFSALKIERNVMFLILTLIIIVAAFNIISGLTILIKNKTKEIAILKTLGLSNYSIKKSFFLTGFTIGFSATVAGLILGVIFSIYIEEIRILLSTLFDLNIFPPDVYFLDKMPSEINIKSIFIIFVSSLFITSIASFFPARSISKMKILNALKYE